VFAVGLTGGIASGKSLVDQAFVRLGIAVVDADALAREVVASGQPALHDIVAAFGPEVLQPDGSLDRVAMRRRVFADANARRELETITHPRIRVLLQDRCRSASSAYVIASIPLLAEAGAADAYRWLRRILVVDAPLHLRLARLASRDGIDAALALRMVEAQASRETRLALASDVIVNDAGLDDVGAAVARLDTHYRNLALATQAG
jgi:dephospho-CoA kinase